MADDLLTAQEAADYLKVKKSTVYEMIKRGEIPSTKIGKQLRIPRANLEAFFHPPTAPRQDASLSPQEALPLPQPGTLVLCGQEDRKSVV